MKRWLIWAGLVCSLSERPVPAQIFTNPVIVVAADPSGACPARRIALSIASGNAFYCSASTNTWAVFGTGSGSGTVASGTAGQVAYYTGTGTAVGGASGTTWTDATRDFVLVNGADPLFFFSANPVGDANGVLFGSNYNQIGPPTVAGATGTLGAYIQISDAGGGNTSITTSGTGGAAGGIYITGVSGGGAPNAATASTGGNAGPFQFLPGPGGPAIQTGINIAGKGGDFDSGSGHGGQASGGTFNTAGDAGKYYIRLGNGGVAETANPTNGLDGTLLIRAGARANANIAEFQLNAGTHVLAVSPLGYLTGQAGNAPAVSGCTAAAIVAGSTGLAGQINGTPTGACAVTLTFDEVAPHGYNCAISNMTTANLIRQSATTTNTAVFTGVTVANDVLAYGPCVGW